MIRRLPLLTAVCLLATSVFATTFVVPSDRHMVSTAKVVVSGSVQTSFTQLTEAGAIETVSEVKIEEVLKGTLDAASLKVHTPGGTYRDRSMIAVGAARFRDGEKVLLFLNETKGDRWVVLNLALGKFGLATDTRGRKVALRQEADIHGWTVDGARHTERRRDAAKFMSFIRAVAAGRAAEEDYFVAGDAELEIAANEYEVAPNDTFAPNTYLFSFNPRWSSFPRTFTHTNTISGAPNGGVTAITTSMALWNDDAQSNVVLQHGGLDATKTNGTLGANDGANAVQWEVDLSGLGAPAYICGVGGVLGYANLWTSGPPHAGPGGVNYPTISEGNIDMNKGLQGCAGAINSNTFILGLTHEFGHTLGFRHADENPNGSTPCGAPNECVPAKPAHPAPDAGPHAVMRSIIANNIPIALQAYDQNAVRAVYPQPVVTPPPAPTGLTATSTGSTTVALLWTASAGATNYKVFRRTAGGTFSQIGTSVSTSFNDTTSTGLAAGSPYQYVVRATNDGGDSADSNSDFTLTMVFTELLTPGLTIRSIHFTELGAAVSALRTLAGLGTFSFATPAPDSGVTITKAHIDGVRAALNEARVALGASALTLTDPTVVAGTTAVKATHVTELRNGVF